MPRTDFVDHVNIVKLIDTTNEYSTSDMANMMNEWKVEVSKLRGFRAGQGRRRTCAIIRAFGAVLLHKPQ